MLGQHKFIAFYLTAGVFSIYSSMVTRVRCIVARCDVADCLPQLLMGRSLSTIGSSGAVMGVVMLSLSTLDRNVSFFGVDMHSFVAVLASVCACATHTGIACCCRHSAHGAADRVRCRGPVSAVDAD